MSYSCYPPRIRLGVRKRWKLRWRWIWFGWFGWAPSWTSRWRFGWRTMFLVLIHLFTSVVPNVRSHICLLHRFCEELNDFSFLHVTASYAMFLPTKGTNMIPPRLPIRWTALPPQCLLMTGYGLNVPHLHHEDFCCELRPLRHLCFSNPWSIINKGMTLWNIALPLACMAMIIFGASTWLNQDLCLCWNLWR